MWVYVFGCVGGFLGGTLGNSEVHGASWGASEQEEIAWTTHICQAPMGRGMYYQPLLQRHKKPKSALGFWLSGIILSFGPVFEANKTPRRCDLGPW